jgi:hypothetical protein
LCWHILRTASNTILSFISLKLDCLVLARFRTDSERVGVDVMALMTATTQVRRGSDMSRQDSKNSKTPQR